MGAIRVWTTGDWSRLETMRAALAVQPMLDVAPGAPEDEAPDVVVHVASEAETLAGEIAHVREHTSAPIVLLTAIRSTAFVDEAVRVDAVEVLLLPQAAESVAFAILRTARAEQERRAARGAARVVTVFSPKGGTGKSVTACNLAVTLAELGKRTLLVDLDLQFGDVAIMLGLQPDKTLHDLVTSPGRLDGEKLAGFTVRHACGVDVLAAPIRPEDAEEISDTKIADLLEVASGEYEFVVVDTAPFLFGPTLETFDRTTDLVLLCAPDVPAMKNVRLTMQTLGLLSFDDARVRLVLNRASARLGLRAAEVGSVLDRTVDYEFPEDELVTVAVNRAKPIVQHKPDAPFSVALRKLAADLSGEPVAEAEPQQRRRFALGRSR
jgi:pilus assembly protein CpaE